MPPPTPAPSPSEPSPLQAGGVPFTGRAPVAHRLFDDELEPEPVLERPPYRGPTPLNTDLPEPFVLKEEAVVSPSKQFTFSRTSSQHQHNVQICRVQERANACHCRSLSPCIGQFAA